MADRKSILLTRRTTRLLAAYYLLWPIARVGYGLTVLACRILESKSLTVRPESPREWARFFVVMPAIPVGWGALRFGEALARPAHAVRAELMRSAD